MPIFEYRCPDCGAEFEELVLGNAKPKCPKCSSPRTEKLMSCCRHKSAGTGGDYAPAGGATSKCGGCSGGSCATCK